MKKAVKYDGYLRRKGAYLGIDDCHRFIIVFSVARVKVNTLCLVGDFGWEGHFGVGPSGDNRGVAFLVYLNLRRAENQYMVFFFIQSYFHYIYRMSNSRAKTEGRKSRIKMSRFIHYIHEGQPTLSCTTV